MRAPHNEFETPEDRDRLHQEMVAKMDAEREARRKAREEAPPADKPAPLTGGMRHCKVSGAWGDD